MFELLLLPITLVLLLLILLAPLIFIYLFLRLSGAAFQMVGFSHWHATLAVFGSILGSLVDLPLTSIISSYPEWYLDFMSLFYSDVPAQFHPLILAVNLGGCIIPVLISAHLIFRHQVSMNKALLGVGIVAFARSENAGIGGNTATAVGERLRTVADSRQVLAITHLPQVASRAESHFTITKDPGRETAAASVTELEGESLIEEIRRMMGADSQDEAATRHARELVAANR